MRKNLYLMLVALAGIVSGGSVLLVPAFAQAADTPAAPPAGQHWGPGAMHSAPGVFGTVTAVNGTTLTVTRKAGPKDTSGTSTTYTVAAGSATVTKNGAASTLSDVAVNDMVMVQGTVSGTDVTATAIRDGVPTGGPMGGRGMRTGSSTPDSIITGNGQPVIGGTVSTVSGSTLTVTNKSNVTYTVDAGSATIEKAGKAGAVSDIATGDAVVIQGTVNGTSVTASSVMDSGVPKTEANGKQGGPMGGFLGGIGGFFKKLFGFF